MQSLKKKTINVCVYVFIYIGISTHIISIYSVHDNIRYYNSFNNLGKGKIKKEHEDNKKEYIKWISFLIHNNYFLNECLEENIKIH